MAKIKTNPNESLLESAEKQIVNSAVATSDMVKIVHALRNAAYKFIPEKRLPKALGALDTFLDQVYSSHVEHESNLLVFVGVGGEEAKKYSLEQFKKYFNENDQYMIMHFLQSNGSYPSGWSKEEEEKFRQEAKDKLNKE